MELRYDTLSTFTETLSTMLDRIPYSSNSFYNIGNGLLNLYRVAEETPYEFVTYTESGVIDTGENPFYVSRNADSIYGTFTLKNGTGLVVNNAMELDNTIVEIHGIMSLTAGSVLTVSNGTSLIFYSDSTLKVDLSNYYSTEHTNPSIITDNTNTFKIYGNINITLPDIVPSEDESEIRELKLAALDSIINNPNIYIDSAAHINVTNLVESLNLGERETSLTDYEYILRSRIINIYTQGETNTHIGRIGYTWKDGHIETKSQILQMIVLWGDAILGDFKLSILGKQLEEIPNLQVLESFKVMKNTTLYISELFEYEGNTYRYIRPELYLGRVIENCKTPGHAQIDGTIIVDGSTAKITIDREATLIIGEKGRIKLQNGAILHSAYNNDKEVLTINGVLEIDYIEQLVGFNSNNIVFGEHGRLIINNPESEERRLLWSTPNGIKTSQLYNLFGDRLDKVEYHIHKNTGIAIDQYYSFFGRDMTEWYNGMRIEKAIHEGLIVWHDEGFIELDHDVIPWADTTCSLLQAARLFKSYGSYDTDKLQEVVSRLKYAGAGNIKFRFIEGEQYVDVLLNLEGTEAKSVVPIVNTDSYEIDTTNDGNLFIRNMISDAESVITPDAKMVLLNEGTTEFSLDN